MTSVAISEIMLSLYPIIVKTTNTNIFTQVFVRSLVYATFSIIFMSLELRISHKGSSELRISHKGSLPVYTTLLTPSFIIISIVNLIHIFSSYIAFINLDAGVAMTLFYIYPFFNIIMKSLLERSTEYLGIVKYIFVSFIGVALISLQQIGSSNGGNKYYLLGIVSILIAALTESLIYTFYKQKSELNPFNGIFTLYGFSAIVMILFAPKFLQTNTDSKAIMNLILFNVMIGLLGHLFRFYGIPRISTEVYSVNLFVGVISAYIFGWYFVGEEITVSHIVGSILILYSVYKVNLISNK